MRKSELAALRYHHIQVWQRIAAQTADQNVALEDSPVIPAALVPGAVVTVAGGNVTVALGDLNKGQFHDNTGATGATYYELPLDAILGDRYRFAVLAAQTVKIEPGAAGIIQVAAAGGTPGATSTAGQNYINAGILGSEVEFVCIGSTGSPGGVLWLASRPFGTWTLGT